MDLYGLRRHSNLRHGRDDGGERDHDRGRNKTRRLYARDGDVQTPSSIAPVCYLRFRQAWWLSWTDVF